MTDSDKIRQAVRSALATFRSGKLRELSLRQLSLLLDLSQVAEQFDAKSVSRDGQKKSRPARRANLVPRDDWIRKFYADKQRADSKYSISQLGEDLRATHNKFYKQLRPGGKFLSDEQLRLIVKS